MHADQHAASADSRSQLSATAQEFPVRTAGCQRAKHLRLAHANPILQLRRERVAGMLVALFGEVKQIALAAEFGVSRTLALRWLNVEAVDKNPAPLALMLALDEESFERTVEALRAERALDRSGR